MSLFELKFSNASDFETNFSQRVRFLFKSFTARQILDLRKHNALDFEYKTFRHVRFWKNFCIRKTTFGFILFRENDMFRFFVLFWRACSWIENSITWQIVNWKKIQLVRFWVENSTNCKILDRIINTRRFRFEYFTCQILSVLFLQFANFSCVLVLSNKTRCTSAKQ